MTTSADTRMTLLSLAISWTVFAGMKAADTPLWPSLFVGSLCGVVAFALFFAWAMEFEKEQREKDRKNVEVKFTCACSRGEESEA